MSDKRIRKNLALLQQASSQSLSSTPASSLTPMFADMPSLTSLSAGPTPNTTTTTTGAPSSTSNKSSKNPSSNKFETATTSSTSSNFGTPMMNPKTPMSTKSTKSNNNINNKPKFSMTNTTNTSFAGNNNCNNGVVSSSATTTTVSGTSTPPPQPAAKNTPATATSSSALSPSSSFSATTPKANATTATTTVVNSSPAAAPTTPQSSVAKRTKGIAKPKFSLGLVGESTASSMSRQNSSATTNSQPTPATATSTFGGLGQSALQQQQQQQQQITNNNNTSTKPLNNQSISSLNEMLRQDSCAFANQPQPLAVAAESSSNNTNNNSTLATSAEMMKDNTDNNKRESSAISTGAETTVSTSTPTNNNKDATATTATAKPATTTTSAVKATTKLRKVVSTKKPKLPSMSLGLDLDNNGNEVGGTTGVVEVTKKSVTKTEMEHLIVDCETSLDSPFIATSGQFPGGQQHAGSGTGSGAPPSSMMMPPHHHLPPQPGSRENLFAAGGIGLPINTKRTNVALPSSSSGGNLTSMKSKSSFGLGLGNTTPPANNNNSTTSFSAASSSTTSSAAGTSTGSKRKFFRIDESNLFVFVDDPSAGKQTDLLPGSHMSEVKLDKDGNNNNNNTSSCSGPATSSSSNTFTTSSTRGGGGSSSGSPVGKGGIPFEKLVFGGILGHGAQGQVHAVNYQGKNYALKKISVSDALDRGQAHVERQARKNGIVRELQMVAARDEACVHLVGLHNAYFRKDSGNNNNNNASSPGSMKSSSSTSSFNNGEQQHQDPSSSSSSVQQHLYILMERMSMSVEDMKNMAARVPVDEVRKCAQKCFGDKISGTPVDGRKVERKMFRPNEYVASAQRHTPLPEIVIGVIAADILRGLAHLHGRLRLVHTDLKPANMMLSENMETAKIADFGCSQQLNDQTHDVTVNNVILGTKLYMSPERAKASYGLDLECTFDEKSDIWAFGISMLELAAGCHPCDHFREEYWNFSSMLKWNNLAKPESMAYDFVDFLKRCLDPDPCTRATSDELQKHEFIRRFERANRQKLAVFVKSLKTLANEFNIKTIRSSLKEHVTSATTLTADVKRNSVQTWKGFSKGIRGIVPDHADEDKFPKLGE